ncbi:MAG: sensor histidine kinase [Polyangiales bacterium]
MKEWHRWILGVGAPLCACALPSLLGRWVPPTPHLLLYPAVLLVASLAGRGPGFLSVVLSASVIAYRARSAFDLGIFVAVCAVMVTSITRRQVALERAEKAREQLERADQAKNEVLAVVSHDLRSPIVAISLSAESILRHPERERVSTDAERIRRLAHAAGDLVRDIAELSNAEAGTLHLSKRSHGAAELLRAARDAAVPEAEHRRIALVVEVQSHEQVICDGARIRQVLSNLVANALKHTQSGGEVRLAVGRDGYQAKFEVRDTGVGIRSGDLEKVFERSWTTDRSRGSGLGLYISRALVRAHGGDIGVESAPGQGSVFWFTLPLSVTDDSDDAAPSNGRITDRSALRGS